MPSNPFRDVIASVFVLAVAAGCSQQVATEVDLSRQVLEGDTGASAVRSPVHLALDDQAATASSRQGADRSKPPTDELSRELVVGKWKDEYQGHRTLTIRPDGTATMLVELQGIGAKLYAEKMTFQEEWEIDKGKITFLAVSGEPEARVNLVLTAMGNTSVQTIIELNQDRMLLLDPDGVTKYDWQRVDGD